MSETSRSGWIGLGLAVVGLVAAFVLEQRQQPATLKNPGRRRRRRRRRLEVGSCERTALREARPATFRRKGEGVAALLDANPDLHELLESECAEDCSAFKRWQRGGRRGPKPPGHADGRFDALNERFNLRGKRKVGNWLEGVYKVVPSSRRWEDFDELVPVLEEATGMRVHVPERTDEIKLARQMAERCKDLPEIVLEEAPF